MSYNNFAQVAVNSNVLVTVNGVNDNLYYPRTVTVVIIIAIIEELFHGC